MFHHHLGRQADQLGTHRVDVPDDVRPGLLRGRNDARGRGPLRHGPLRRRVPSIAASVRRDDRRRHAVQQDGAGAAQGLRPDAGTALGHLDGLLRQRRRLLSLFLLRGARLRPHRAGRRLRAGLPADGRGAVVRHHAIAEQDQAHQHHRALIASRIAPITDRPQNMTTQIEVLQNALATALGERASTVTALGEVTITVKADDYLAVMQQLRDDASLHFEQIIDLCGVDYSTYGDGAWDGLRFAAVSHLLSIKHNWRVRVRVFAPDDDMPLLHSVTGIWRAANWYEREAFDMFGILFDGHNDLRRILTDYGFIGHPFRKDFPVSGYVEMRYDPEQKRVIYQPVTIEPRENVPRVIREEHYWMK